MSLDAVKILEINITIYSKNEILEFIRKGLVSGAKNSQIEEKNASITKRFFTIVTPNPEQIVFAKRDSHFQKILNQADVSIPDGVGVVWAAKFLHLLTPAHYPLPTIKTIPGIDFMENLVSEAAKQRVGVALIGGRDGLALKTFDCLSKTHTGLRGWAIDGPEAVIHRSSLIVHSQENTEEYFRVLAKRIVDSGVRIVFVGLGAPKQEYFIEKLSRFLPTTHYPLPTILMSVGGSFDEIAGRIPRTPKWISRIGLKWFWRLILEPWRIRRQLSLITFIWLVLKERYRKI